MKVILQVVLFFSSMAAAHCLLPREKYVAFYCTAALLIGMAIGCDLPDAYRLYRQGMTKEGIVRQLDCKNHGGVAYDFQYAQHTYSNRGTFGMHCEELHVGVPIVVTFLAAEPEQSVVGSARGLFFDQLAFMLSGMLFFPAVMIWSYRRRQRQLQR